jgi:MFS family permease
VSERDGSLRAGASAVAATGASILPVALLGAVIVQLRSDIAISTVGLGGVIALFYLVSALASIPAGGLIDRLGWPRSIWLASMCIALPLLAIATVARTTLHVAVAMVIAGLGNALAQPAANLAIIRGVALRRQGIAFGVKQAAVPAGTLIAGAAVPLIALTIGWRWAFILPAAGVIVLTMVAPLRAPGRSEGIVRARLGGLVRDPLLLMLAAANAGSSMAINPLFAFFVESSVARGISPGAAGSLLALGSAMGLSSRLLIGWVTDRMSPSLDRMLRDMSVYALLGSPGFLILGLFGDRAVMIAVGLFFAIGFGFAWSGLFNLVVTRAWHDRPASASGVTQAGLWVGGMLGPLLFGRIATSSYAVAWTVSAGFMFVSAALLLTARRALVRREGALR